MDIRHLLKFNQHLQTPKPALETSTHSTSNEPQIRDVKLTQQQKNELHQRHLPKLGFRRRCNIFGNYWLKIQRQAYEYSELDRDNLTRLSQGLQDSGRWHLTWPSILFLDIETSHLRPGQAWLSFFLVAVMPVTRAL